MVDVVGYAYPWDFVGDDAAAERAAGLGVSAVAVAATYHASRVVSPLHPRRRVRDIPHSALYVPVREEIWRGHRLVPAAPTWLDEPHAFAVAEKSLTAAGLQLNAWIVLTHQDDLGVANPDLVVRNAFDEAYPYALCPRHEDVRRYCVTLVREVLEASKCSGVVLEALGPMGIEHGTIHDKTEFATWGQGAQDLLSLCFCAACRRGLAEQGIDVDRLAQLVRDGVDQDAPTVEAALGNELADQLAAFRLATSAVLRNEVVTAVRRLRPRARITVHTSSHRWNTGSFPAWSDDSFTGLTTTVANCWDHGSAGRELLGLQSLTKGQARVGGYLRLDRDWPNRSTIEEKIAAYVHAGMNELHLYHLGLVANEGLEAAARIIESARGHWRRHAERHR